MENYSNILKNCWAHVIHHGLQGVQIKISKDLSDIVAQLL